MIGDAANYAPDVHPVTVEPSRFDRARLAWGVVAIAVGAAGLLARLWLWSHSATSADEGVVGLMADQVLRGHFSAFYWGQRYGGAEPDVVAAMFALFGHNSGALTATSIVLAAVASALLYFLGAELFTRRVGAYAAGLAWVWPCISIFQSTKEYGFRGVTTVAGLSMLVSTARLVQRGSSALRWIALGLGTGLGWWASPETAYYAIPAGAVLVYAAVRFGITRRAPNPFKPVEMGVGLLAGALGALPWIVDNLPTGFSSLATPANTTAALPYWQRFHLLVVESVPMALGLRRPMTGDWLGGPHLGVTLLIVILVITGVGVIGVLARGVTPGLLLVGFLAGFLFVMAKFPETSYYADGRYVCYLPGIVALVVAGGWSKLLPSRPLVGRLLTRVGAVALLGGASVLSGAGVFGVVPASGAELTLRPIGDRIGYGVALGLEANGIRNVIAQYWVAYDLDFFGQGRLTATPLTPVRLPRMQRRVFRSTGAAWLFVNQTPTDIAEVDQGFLSGLVSVVGLDATAFIATLTGDGVTCERLEVGPFVVVVPRGDHPTWWIIDRFL